MREGGLAWQKCAFLSASDQWPGGFFFEVLLHAENGWWEQKVMVDVAFATLESRNETQTRLEADCRHTVQHAQHT